jgi:metal-dependent amidase/aminoacylase/carboxypeptidase family protein
MAERILFPDAVAAVVGALNDQLDDLGFSGVPVRSRVPNPRPARFVTVFRTGGPRVNVVTDSAQITVEAWAASDHDAHDLAQAARAILNSLEATVTGGATVYGVDEFSGPAYLPDPESAQPRYTWSASVNIRGAAA